MQCQGHGTVGSRVRTEFLCFILRHHHSSLYGVSGHCKGTAGGSQVEQRPPRDDQTYQPNERGQAQWQQV